MSPKIIRQFRAATWLALFVGLSLTACSTPPTNPQRQDFDREPTSRGEDTPLGNLLALQDEIDSLKRQLDTAQRELRTEREAKTRHTLDLEAERQRRAVAEEDAEQHAAVRNDLESQILALRIHAAELEGEILKLRIREQTQSVAAPLGGRR